MIFHWFLYRIIKICKFFVLARIPVRQSRLNPGPGRHPSPGLNLGPSLNPALKYTTISLTHLPFSRSYSVTASASVMISANPLANISKSPRSSLQYLGGGFLALLFGR